MGKCDIDIGSNLKQIVVLALIVIFACVAIVSGSSIAEALTGVTGIGAIFLEAPQFFGAKEVKSE